MASKYASTAQTTNAARLSRAIIGPCTDLYRDILRMHIPEMQFLTNLGTMKSKLCNHINKEQRILLFPPNGQFIGNYNDFDLVLLYSILRNVSGIKAHNSGWGNTPNTTDRSESANIDRIREIRNKYCGHQLCTSLAHAEFKKVWAELKQIVGQLDCYVSGGHNTYLNAIKLLEKETMDPEQEERYLSCIDNQHKSISDIQVQSQRQGEELDKLSTLYLNQDNRICKLDQQHEKSLRNIRKELRKLSTKQQTMSETLKSGRDLYSVGRKSSFSSKYPVRGRNRAFQRERGQQRYPAPRQKGRPCQELTKHEIKDPDLQIEARTTEMTWERQQFRINKFFQRSHGILKSDSQIYNPNWCVCGKCREMTSKEENICCRETPQNCISTHQLFDLKVLDQPNLVTPRDRQTIMSARESNELNRRVRQAAYQTFTFLMHGHLGAGKRRVIPSCCVWRIRDHYPDSTGQYTGFNTVRFR